MENWGVVHYFEGSLVEELARDFRPVDLKRLDWHRVYCQACGGELTEVGGLVSTSGKAYCDSLSITGSNYCLEKEILVMMRGEIPKQAIGFNLLEPERLQDAVKSQRLVAFGPLELKV